MALYTCCNCGKKVWDQATSCMHCGTPLEETLRLIRERKVQQEVKAEDKPDIKVDNKVDIKEKAEADIKIDSIPAIKVEVAADDKTDNNKVVVESAPDETKPIRTRKKSVATPPRPSIPKPAIPSDGYDYDTEGNTPDNSQKRNAQRINFIIFFVAIVIMLVAKCTEITDTPEEEVLIEEPNLWQIEDTIFYSNRAITDVAPHKKYTFIDSEKCQWQKLIVDFDEDLQGVPCYVMSCNEWMRLEYHHFVNYVLLVPVENLLKKKPLVILAMVNNPPKNLQPGDHYSSITFPIQSRLTVDDKLSNIFIWNPKRELYECRIQPFGSTQRYVGISSPVEFLRIISSPGRYELNMPYCRIGNERDVRTTFDVLNTPAEFAF